MLPLVGVTEDYTAISDFKWGIDDRIMNECVRANRVTGYLQVCVCFIVMWKIK